MEKTCENCKFKTLDASEPPCSVCIHCDDSNTENRFESKKTNAVEHPDHYNHGMECIDEMIAVFGKGIVSNFCLCNVWKYRKRAIFKNGKEDMEKADWYMNKYIELGGESNAW